MVTILKLMKLAGLKFEYLQFVCANLWIHLCVILGIKMASTGGGCRRIFLAQFRPDSDVQMVSVGVSHVKFWTLAGSQLIGKDPIFPKSVSAKMQTMLSMAFAPVRMCCVYST